jgi:hypothetical protein
MRRRYDNDEATLVQDRARLSALVARVDARLRIIALTNNEDALDPYATAEQEREDYFVLNRRALQFERELCDRAQQELSERFSLLRVNHPFEHSVGDECHYSAPEMTLAFKRVACPVEPGDAATHGGVWWWFMIIHALLLLYAALHLWRLLQQ